jgi:hypothetical protein
MGHGALCCCDLGKSAGEKNSSIFVYSALAKTFSARLKK